MAEVKSKRVNLHCPTAVKIDGINYSGNIRDTILPVDTIRKCILSRIMVEEILPDGTKVPLGFYNYNKDLMAKEEEKKSEEHVSIKTVKNFKVVSYDKHGNIIKDTPIAKHETKTEKKPESKKEEKIDLKSSIFVNSNNKKK